jgi:carbonic anhydrase/acetyltransferase-like protein (isoleucine patch superfamily)
MIIEYHGKRPKIGNRVFIAPTAVIIGDVEIADGASIWFGAVLRGDEGRILIGEETNVQDNAVLHTTHDFPTILSSRVTVGHGALLEGCFVEEGAVIGMGAVVLQEAVIGSRSLIGAGSVVTRGTIIPKNSLAAGSPAVVKKEISGAALRSIERSAAIYVELSASYLEEGIDKK